MPLKELKKSLTFIEALAIVIGGIIGSGIFLKPGIVFNNAGSPILGLLAWVVGGIVTLASALTIAEIASAIPKTGGLYIYLKELYGDFCGFLLGWVQSVITYPATVAALAIAFATFSTFFIPMTGAQQKLLAVGIVLFAVVMNIIATKLGGIIQTLATIGKLVPIVGIITYGLLKGTAHDFTNITASTTGAGFGVAILGTLWAYDGWINVTNMAGELKNPSKQVPKSLIIGVGSVIGVYVLMNVAMLNVMPIGSIINSKNPSSDIAVILFGSNTGAFIIAGMMVSVFGAMNAFVMTGARVPLAMSELGLLPFHKTFSKVHSTFKTPAHTLILECVLAIIYILSGTFDTLTDLLIFVLWIFFVMGVAGIFIIRKNPTQYTTNYRVPFFPIVPLIGILGGAYILISTVVSQPKNSFIGIGITLIGVPIFYYLRNKKNIAPTK